MRLIVAGSRYLDDYALVSDTLDHLLQEFDPEDIECILCGKAKGADTFGEWYGTHHGIPITYYPADWDKYGKSAGYRRNADMAKNATHLVAFWDGESKGTKHMIDLAHKHGLEVTVIQYIIHTN